jgi:polysaccharide export outer membrane protein
MRFGNSFWRFQGGVALLWLWMAWPAGAAPATVGVKGMVVGAEDTVTIVCLEGEEISRAWRVGSSGDLNLPMIGSVRAAGLTVEQLQAALVEKLKVYIREPQVTVYISEFRSQPVTISGAVDKPGTMQLQGSRSLFEVLMMTGGPKEAGPSVTLTRAIARGRIPWPGAKDDAEGNFSVADFPLKEVMDARTPAANLTVEPFDVISVSNAKQVNLVHVIGEVTKPGAIELLSQNTVSLVKAVALAGGMTRGALPAKTQIMHIGEGGKLTESAGIDLKMIMAGKAKDLELQPGDVVVIPSSQMLPTIRAMAMTAFSASFYLLATL